MFSENEAEQGPDGQELIGRVDLETRLITVQGNFTGDMARLFPNGIIVDRVTSTSPCPNCSRPHTPHSLPCCSRSPYYCLVDLRTPSLSKISFFI
eukprot:62771-Pyramimonas_sp.AAC.1